MTDFRQGVASTTMSVSDVSAYLDLSPDTVRALVQDGQLAGYRLGNKRLLIWRESVAAYLEEQQAIPPYDEVSQARARENRRRRTAMRLRPSIPLHQPD